MGTVAPRRALDAGTVAEAFRMTTAERPDRVAVRTKGDAVRWTWGELRRRVDDLAGGLHRLGVGRGDTVALMLSNRPEFHLADLAAMTLGATPFSIYNSLAPEQIRYVARDAGAKVLVVEQAVLQTALLACRDLPQLEHVIVVDGDPPEGCLALGDVEHDGVGAGFDAATAAAAVSPDDLVTIIYTSGTTGPPKGVQLSHHNVMEFVRIAQELVEIPDDGRVISWLPAAHVAERNAHHYLPVALGLEITCCDEPREILSYLPDARPSWFFAVPRIWEKLKAGLETMVAGLPDEQREPTERALACAIEKVRLEQRGEPVPEELATAVARADARVFAPLRAQLGLDSLEAVNVGAAPTPVEVLEFFHAIGVPVGELWGMSETTGAGTCNPRGRVKIGTVGPPNPGVEIRLADDGEVLIRGDIVMVGYRNQPDTTAEAIDAQGWLRTGDIGEIDEDGYLRIVDRKKEIIINAAGKNMSPANIEATLKSASPLIGQAAVIGDARPYNVALIVLDADFAPAWAALNGLERCTLEELAGSDAVLAAVQLGVDAANAKLSHVEQIRRIHVVEGDWLPGGDELTPTMKLRRTPIAEKYADAIAAMYRDSRG